MGSAHVDFSYGGKFSSNFRKLFLHNKFFPARLLEENPSDRDLLKRRGDFYEAIGKYPEAVADYSKFIALNPDDAKVFHSRGAIYWLHLDNPELARADFNSELKIHDKKIELNFNKLKFDFYTAVCQF